MVQLLKLEPEGKYIYAVAICVLRPSGVCSVLGGNVWHGTGQYHYGRDGYCGSEVVWLIVWTVLTGTLNKNYGVYHAVQSYS